MRLISKFFLPILRLFPPETSHIVSLSGLKAWSYFKLGNPKPTISNSIELLGLEFSNRLGLAAGLDKSADFIDPLSHLGFAFLELGTLTPRPQKGNQKPRLFRISKNSSLINRMGFNNKGIEYAISNIKKSKSRSIIGISIGKNFDTPLDKSFDDYTFCLEKAYPVSDYIAINISSPNTKDLRKLESKQYFSGLITSLKKKQEVLSKSFGYKPIVFKLSPDLEEGNLEEICKEILDKNIDGIICTNTTVSHNYPHEGGLSGEDLFNISNQNLVSFRSYLGPTFPIIASGGVMSHKHYKKKLELGAQLVQVYTGMIYKGPLLISQILES